jgi:DNA polymerase-4
MSASDDRVQWLFLDLNSYFASVEQELNPHLRGRPLGILPIMAENSCCIAVSREAKKLGVRSPIQMQEALRICPGMAMVESRPQRYVEYHHKIVEAVESCIPVTAIHSIDEMACRLDRRETDPEQAIRLAQRIKATMRERVGTVLTCSIGLAPNKWLAKVGSDMQKPDGLTLIRRRDLPDKLLKLVPNDLPGIGGQMNKRLITLGITTTAQLWALSKRQMRNIWGGIVGERFWHWLHGDDIPDVVTKNSSLGHSHVLPPEMRSDEGAGAILQKLLHRAALRMRKSGWWCTGMVITIGFFDDRTWAAKTTFTECQDTLTLLHYLRQMWETRPPLGRNRASQVSVTLYGLVPDSMHNFSLFEDTRRHALSQAMDKVNARYGRDTTYFAGILPAKEHAPTRVPFSNSPAECDWA